MQVCLRAYDSAYQFAVAMNSSSLKAKSCHRCQSQTAQQNRHGSKHPRLAAAARLVLYHGRLLISRRERSPASVILAYGAPRRGSVDAHRTWFVWSFHVSPKGQS
eukprot:21778-Chlamydomonas_euryale.AAC.1